MTYIDGFVLAVPTANRDAYLAHAEQGAAMLKEHGATRSVEGWGDDVPRGQRNDLYGAVQATADETIVFSWIEYPDKAARDATGAKVIADPGMNALVSDMPFDGKRMIFGGFASVSDAGVGKGTGYIDGVVLPLPADRRDDYAGFAAACAPVFLRHGALRVFDAVADDVPDGKVTDFPRAVLREDGETVAFGWIEWPSKDVRDAGWAAIMAGGDMPGDQPFDGKRMIFGGFVPLLDR